MTFDAERQNDLLAYDATDLKEMRGAASRGRYGLRRRYDLKDFRVDCDVEIFTLG